MDGRSRGRLFHMSDNPYAAPNTPPPAIKSVSFRPFKRPAAGAGSLILTTTILFFCGKAVTLFSNADQAYVFFAMLGFGPETFLSGLVWTPITFQFLHENPLTLIYSGLLIFFFGTDVEREVNRPFLMFVFFLITALITAGLLTTLVYFERLGAGPHLGMLPFAYALGVLFLFQTARLRIGWLPVWIPALCLLIPGLLPGPLAPFAWSGILGGFVCRILFAIRAG